jgi:hypothetical protein
MEETSSKLYTYINEGIMGAGAMTFEFHWKSMESWVGTKTFTLFQWFLKGKDYCTPTQVLWKGKQFLLH